MKLSIEIIKQFIPQDVIYHELNDYSWGTTIYLITKDGKGMCRIYQENDNIDDLYISDLSVITETQRNGIGTKLINIFINIGKFLNTNLILFCDKKYFVYNWYKKIGFKYLEDKKDDDRPNMIWMIKRR